MKSMDLSKFFVVYRKKLKNNSFLKTVESEIESEDDDTIELDIDISPSKINQSM